MTCLDDNLGVGPYYAIIFRKDIPVKITWKILPELKHFPAVDEGIDYRIKKDV